MWQGILPCTQEIELSIGNREGRFVRCEEGESGTGGSRVLDLVDFWESRMSRLEVKQKSRGDVGGNNSSAERADSGGTTCIVRPQFEGD